MATPSQIFGSCACERNQYTILVPAASTSLAQVFFDNSAANRRSQATPLTAWLRVPLSWYHSQTFALFPDETHSSIRRAFHTSSASTSTSRQRDEGERGEGGGAAITRRQFCGYCGTHLSAWDEGQSVNGNREGVEGEGGDEWMDVTLGSLLDESLRMLEEMGVLESSDTEGEDEVDDHGATVGREVTMSNTTPAEPAAVQRRRGSQPPRPMRNRGMPFFESMVENSRLGRIKRQKGGHASRDGRRTVEWEVVEIDGGEENDGRAGVEEGMDEESRSKRPRLEP